MQDSYPNLTLSELQGSYQPFGEILGVTDNSTNSGVDGTAPPPTKRRATTGNTQDSFGGSSEMGPTADVGGPFITGIMRNETLPGNVAPQTTTATSWDPSQMSDMGSLTPQDSQMILDSTPGCSTWNMLQQSQVSAVTTPTSHTVQNTPDQSSESYCSATVTGQAIPPSVSGQPIPKTQNHLSMPGTSRHSFYALTRRPQKSNNKPCRCSYPGCNKMFYQRSHLFRHQRQKKHHVGRDNRLAPSST
ncbi:hypothetical protein LSAT2_021709 [Lamellibrachia satsuma]|nr:hypothetical protein LSAT2_021709 [Lamellibrachia satsuma]